MGSLAKCLATNRRFLTEEDIADVKAKHADLVASGLADDVAANQAVEFVIADAMALRSSIATQVSEAGGVVPPAPGEQPQVEQRPEPTLPIAPEDDQAPTMDRSAEKRLEAIKSDVARRYATRLIEAGSDLNAVESAIKAMQQNSKVGKAVLAEIVKAYGGVRGKPKTPRAAYGMIRAIAAERAARGDNARPEALSEPAGRLPEAGVPGPVQSDEEVGTTGEAPQAGGLGGPGPLGDAGVPDAQQPGTPDGVQGEGAGPGSDTGDVARPDQQSTDLATPAPAKPSLGVSEEELAAIREQAAADRAREAEERAARTRSNYRITDEDAIGSGGPKAKTRANLAAIETLKQIEEENRPATEDEKKILVKYVGWGAFSQPMFADYNREFAKERARLQNLMTPEEYKSARASTINAHYTSPDVIKGMWTALEHLGFKGGRVLEPSAGIGHFIGMQPESMRETSQWTAVELDTISGRITKALYGGADVRIGGFEAQTWPDDHFDLAISNVPFDKTGPSDPRYKTPFSLHDYFFVKALDKVRPGGIVAFITSSYSMDKTRDVARREMEKRGTFLGAIRLPGGNQGAFKANAGTDVTTDIIFFRKRVSGEPVDLNSEWRDLVEIKTPEGPTQINGYFAAHPEMMLGKMRLIGSMYSKGEPVLIGPTSDIDQRIAEAAQNMPADAMMPAETSAAALAEDVDTDVGGIKEGAFYLKDGEIYRRVIGVGIPQKLNKANADRVRSFMGLRDLVDQLFAAQGGQQSTPESRKAIRDELGARYDDFVKKFGPINLTHITERVDKKGKTITTRRRPNFAAFEEDPSAYKVAAIELYDEKSSEAKKAAIFTEDVIAPYKRPVITGPADALAVSLNETGRVDMKLIAQQLGVSEDEAPALMGDTAFLNPRGEQWQTASQYLAGDVVGKIEDAKAAVANGDARYQRNVDALTKVQPEPLTRVEITVPMGASWVPEDVYGDFIREVIGVEGVNVSLNPATKKWRLVVTRRTGSYDAAQAQWGTENKSWATILEATLNSMPIRVEVEDADGNKTRDIEAEEAIQAKATAMYEAFTGQIIPGAQAAIDGWVWQDEERAQRLEALYNQGFNRIVREQHDGSHLTFPGLAKVVSFPDGSTGTINLTPARTSAIWRIIQNGNTLIDHVVGAGKTWTSIMAVMEMKRLGQIRRPMFVVPNHMLHQFSHEFLQAYPSAKILVADKDSMSKDKRKEFAAKAAAEKWDGIIITHSAFGRIRMQDQAYKDYYEEAIAEMVEAKEAAAKEEGKGGATVKDIEKAIKSLRAKLEKLTTTSAKDEGITFEELGVDHLTVDEAHKFKKLWFMTRHTRVRGLPKKESQRATDLYIKIRHLEKSRPGRSALFLTGTPLSNSMAEIYTMMRFLQHDTLKEYGIGEFDSWAQTFGRIVTKTELAPNGRTFRDATSFSSFVNIPELSTLYGRIADTQTAESLKLPRPTVKGGGPVVVASDLSEGEEKYIQSLIQEMDKLKGQKPEKSAPNFLSMFTQGLQIGTDMRLVNPDAPFNPKGKIAKATENILRIWQAGNTDSKSPNKAQLVFLDMGVPGSKGKASVAIEPAADGSPLPPDIESVRQDIVSGYDVDQEADTETDEDADSDDPNADAKPASEEDAEAKAMLVGKYNLYADIKRRLVAGGIPAEQIEFIHDANTDDKKAKLFEKVRNGDVRILLGSSEKMGVGTNVQKRLIALHHIDSPWTPAEVEQRDGRILRQGNLNKEIEIYRYVTKRSFDSYRWQILETKSNFIGQFRAGARGVRIAEEIDAPLPEAAELKAAATGDPRIVEHADLTRQVRLLTAQQAAHGATAVRSRRAATEMRQQIASWQKFVGPYEMDALRVTDLSGDNFKVTLNGPGGRKTEVTKRKDAGEAIKRQILSLAQNGWYSREIELDLGAISGFEMTGVVKKTPDGTVARFSIRGTETYHHPENFIVNEETNPVSLVQRYERLVREMPSYHQAIVASIAKAEKDLPRLDELSKPTPFPKQGELDAARKRLDELARALKPVEGGKKPVVEEDAKSLHEIVNPIDPTASPEEKLRQIAALTAQNKPILDAQLRDMDAVLGTTSNANIKKDETILSKASRPSILAEKPWHGVEHIRDTLRFQTKISTFDQIEKAAEIMLSHGYSIVKIDTKKMLAPKEWGWRFAGFDLRAPNGQLLEWYIIFDTMYAAKKKGHLIFEKWRNETADAREERKAEYAADIRDSYRLYQDAFEDGLRNSGYSGLDDAAADIAKLSASLPVTAAKFSATSAGSGRGDPSPSLMSSQGAVTPGRNQLPSSPSTIARPDLSSKRTTGGLPDFSIEFTSTGNIGDQGANYNAGAQAAPPLDPALSAAAVRRAHEFIAREIKAKRPVRISEDVTNAFLDAAWPHVDMVPKGTKVAALTRIRPITDEMKRQAPWADIIAEFRSLDGGIVTTPFAASNLGRIRGAFSNEANAILFIGVSRGDVGVNLRQVIATRVAHEAVHAVWQFLPRAVKSRLLAHAKTLGVLDMQLGTVQQAIGETNSGTPIEQRTVRDIYEEYHANTPDREDRLDQEAVAHLRELAKAGYFTDAELEPIKKDMALLDDVQALGSEKFSERPALLDAAIQSSQARRTLADHFGATRIEDIGPDDPHPGRVLAFHGTRRNFDRFDTSPASRDPLGPFFGAAEASNEYTYDYSFSEDDGPPRRVDDGGRVIPAVLDMSRVLDVLGETYSPVSSYELISAMQDAGHELDEIVSSRLNSLEREWEESAKDGFSKFDAMAVAGEKGGASRVLERLRVEAIRDWLLRVGYQGVRRRMLNGDAFQGGIWEYVPLEPGHVISATSGNMLFALGSGISDTQIDAATGQSMRRDLDSLGFYSKALEAARGLKQEKGTPEQMLAQLKKAGVKDAEIQATGLDRLFNSGSTTALESDAITLSQNPQEEVWGPRFQTLMSQEYRKAVAGEDLSTQLDILTAKYFNAKNDPPEMRAAMGQEIMRLRNELGPEWMAKYAPDAQPVVPLLPQQQGDRTASPPRRARLKQITKAEIISHLEENRVGLREVVRTPQGYDDIRAIYGQNRDIQRQAIADARNDPALSRVAREEDEAQFLMALGRIATGGPPSRLTDIRGTRRAEYEAARRHVATIRASREAARTQSGELARAQERTTKWEHHSLDPSNPTYRETVIHLPAAKPDFAKFKAESLANGVPEAQIERNYQRFINDPVALAREDNTNFTSGHFSEPNIIGHMMTSMTRHEGKPVYTIDQIQSDWGQELRDAGDTSQEKAERLRNEIAAFGLNERAIDIIRTTPTRLDAIGHAQNGERYANRQSEKALYTEAVPAISALTEEQYNRARLATAELRQIEGARTIPRHPLVNTTDQWTTTTLRRAIRQAAEAGAEYIAIPSGETVVSYNPGQINGMREFYGSDGKELAKLSGNAAKPVEGIVPKNLRKLLASIDKSSPAPARIDRLETPSSGLKGKGFTLFPLTERVKDSVLEYGQPMFALGGGVPPVDPRDSEDTPSLNKVIQSLKDTLGIVPTQTLLGVTIKAGDSEIRLSPRGNVRGQTQTATGAIGVRKSRAIDVISHEAAHYLETTLGAEIIDLQTVHAAELALVNPAATPSEQWAEWFADYMLDPVGASVRAPLLHSAVEDVLEANGMLEGIHETQDLYQQWLERATPEELASDVVSIHAGNSFADLRADRPLGETIPGRMATAYTNTIDDLNPLSKIVRKLLSVADRNGVVDDEGRPISLKVADNPYKIARMFRGSYATGYSWLTKGIANRGETSIAFAPLSKALETLFGSNNSRNWDPAMYQAAGQYLISRRAIAEYDRLEQKQARIEEIDGLMEQGSEAWRQVSLQAQDAATVLERREIALVRQTALMRDRRNALKSAEATVTRLQERIQDKKDDVTAAQMARDANLTERRRRDLAIIERDSQRQLRQVEGLIEEYEQLSTDVAMLEAEIDQLRQKNEAARGQLSGIDEAMAGLRREREATEKRGASRAPTRESKEWHQEFIAKTEADPKYARIKDFAAYVSEFGHGMLTLRHQAGLISDELFEELSKRKDWFVPFQRDMSDASPENTFFRGAGVEKWSPFKKFDGSDRAIINPLETMASDAYSLAQQIAFNDATNALAKLAERAGEGGASIVQVLTREESAEANAATFDRVKNIAMSMGIDEADALRIVSEMEQNFAGSELSLIWSPATKGPVNLPTVPLYRDGERIMVRFTDPEFGIEAFNAMSGMGKETAGIISEILGYPSRLLQQGVTTHPTFIPRNVFRDIFDAWIKTGAMPVITQARGVKAMRDQDFMRRYMEAGGITGGRNLAALTGKEQQLDVLDLAEKRVSKGNIALGSIAGGLLGATVAGPLGILPAAAFGAYVFNRVGALETVESAETMTRLGVAAHAYKRALAHNPSLSPSEAMLEAAFVARDVFDWNRRGSRMIGVVRTITFLNAQIQGMDSAARRLGGENDRGMVLAKHMNMVWRRENGGNLSADEQRALGDAYKTFGRMALYTGLLLSLYALATSGGDDDDKDKAYQDIRDKTKITHSWLPAVFGTDVRIPKAFEWAMPANAIEAIADGIRGRNPHVWDRIVDSVYEIAVPPTVPQGLNLIMGLTANVQIDQMAPWVKRLLGREAEPNNPRQIVGDSLRRLDPEAQFDAWSSQLSIDVAKSLSAVGIPRDIIPSPKKIDFILRTGGYWGQDVQRGYQVLKEAFGGRQREAARISDLPVVAGFTGVAARQSRSRDELFRLVSQQGGVFTTAAQTFKNLIDEQGTPADAERFISRLEPDERTYALLQYYGSPGEKKTHPLDRLKAVDGVANKIRQDIILDRLAPIEKQGRKNVRNFDEKINLNPRQQTQVHEILERLMQAEAWNTMTFLDRPAWKGRSPIKVEPILDELRAANPQVYEIYEDRLRKSRARTWDEVTSQWPDLRDRILREGAGVWGR